VYKHLLIATDGSGLAGKAVTAGLKLAQALGARVTAVTVTEPLDPFLVASATVRGVPNYEERAAADAKRILSKVSEAAGSMAVACSTLHVADQYPAEGIIQAAQQNAAISS
jgi:nucleotide-binding universal stress UspA family protein